MTKKEEIPWQEICTFAELQPNTYYMVQSYQKDKHDQHGIAWRQHFERPSLFRDKEQAIKKCRKLEAEENGRLNKYGLASCGGSIPLDWVMNYRVIEIKIETIYPAKPQKVIKKNKNGEEEVMGEQLALRV